MFSEGGGGSGRRASLRATVFIVSPFQWRLDLLEERLCAALGISTGWGDLKIEDIGGGHPQYMVSWAFGLAYGGIAGENEERLQCQAEKLLAVFNELEEKVKAAQAIEDPLSWLLKSDKEKDLVEACRSDS